VEGLFSRTWCLQVESRSLLSKSRPSRHKERRWRPRTPFAVKGSIDALYDVAIRHYYASGGLRMAREYLPRRSLEQASCRRGYFIEIRSDTLGFIINDFVNTSR